jgi:hypothetical protein
MHNFHADESEGNAAGEQGRPDQTPPRTNEAEPKLFDASGRIVKHEEQESIIRAAKANEAIATEQRKILDRIKRGEKWMILFTAVIALTTVAQFCQSRINNASTSEQIDKVISASESQAGAATRISKAADSFSSSAEGINGQTRAAVGEFHRMAKASETSIEASIESFHLDHRAWVGLFTYGAQDGKTLNLAFRNTGKTPALEVSFQSIDIIYPSSTGEGGGTSPFADPVFHQGAYVDFDEYIRHWNEERGKAGKRPVELPIEIGVIAPDAFGYRNAPLSPDSSFFVGKIMYRDVYSHITRTTKFCLIPGGDKTQACTGGNSMD